MKWLAILLIVGGLAMAGIAGGISFVIQKMAEAIKEFEGWYEGSRSYRNNNPGNLKFASQPGATGADESGHAIFESYQAGWNALVNQITAAFDGRSHVYSLADNFYSFFDKYAEGNSEQYAEFVAARVGVNPNQTLGSLLS